MRWDHLIESGLFVLAEVVVLARAILRPHREPAARFAWVLIIIVAPVVGILAYLLLGEARIGRHRRSRGRSIDSALPRPPADPQCAASIEAGAYSAPFRLAGSVNGLGVTASNRAHLAADSNAAIDEMVADVDAASTSVHASFYIWLADHNGLKVKQAFIRAARRGVKVRVLADAFGSRLLLRSSHWHDLADGGVEAREALPVGNLLWTLLKGRVDLRNHRKQMIVDNRIAWCGSQNTADPEFRIKPHYAPWVDAMTRWEGPAAQHCQMLFVSDWMAECGEDLSALLTASPIRGDGTVTAQIIGTGPTLRFDAMPTCFSELIHAAREELVITTPYFVPDEGLLSALTSAARRGVRTLLLLPKRIDSRIVAATCRSYYQEMISAGIELYEYRCGLLHAKTMIVDRKIGLVGSANLDRRSFELNFENNILFEDADFAATIRARQEEYLADCDRIGEAQVAQFTIAQRLRQNVLAMLSPLL